MCCCPSGRICCPPNRSSGCTRPGKAATSPPSARPTPRACSKPTKRTFWRPMLLSTSRGPGHFRVRPGCRVLYSLAPMPYATGMFPDLISSEITCALCPRCGIARKMSFGQQMRTGYKQAAKYGMNLFFGMSSVLYGATRSLNMLGGEKSYSLKSLLGMSPRMLYRILAAKYRSRRDGAASSRAICSSSTALSASVPTPPCTKTNWRKPGASARWRSRAAPSLPAWAPRPGAKTGLSFSRTPAFMNSSPRGSSIRRWRTPAMCRTPT